MSSSFARFMRTERLVLLVVFSIFSLIVLAMNATYANTEMHTELALREANGFRIQVWPVKSVDTFAVFNIVVCVLTKVTLLPVRIMNWLRPWGFTSTIVFELCWLGVLDVFWIAAAGLTTHSFEGEFSQLCKEDAKDNNSAPNLQLACGVTQASMAFSFLNFIILTAHVVMLLTLAIMCQKEGMSVWTRSVSDVAASRSPSDTVNLVQGSQEHISMKGGMEPAYPAPAAVYNLQPSQPKMGANDGYMVQV